MAEAEKVKCSWCGQEVKGRRLRFRSPGGSRVYVCRHCGMGWAGLLGYAAALVGELVHKPGYRFQVGQGASAFGAANRSER